jgi:acyl carrier protein
MIPSVFVQLERLPLTANGKIDRKALPAPQASRPAEADDEPPRTPAEAILAAIFAEALGLERVGIHANFFALGGHSLLATQIMSRLREAFQVELPLSRLFEAPTPARLAEIVEAALIDLLEAMSEEEAEQLLAGGDDRERA